MAKRSFLFLQGPYGPFFRELGESLLRRGHEVRRINFNAGDALDWGGALTIPYQGRPGKWPAFLKACLREYRVTDLVLFNDSRPIHKAALVSAEGQPVRPWIFEEGYLRPFWITLERSGVNANSRLPRDMNWYIEKSKNLTFPEEKKFKFISHAFKMYKLRYYIMERLGRSKYPYYTYHREFGGWYEISSRLRRIVKKPFDQKESDAVIKQIFNSHKPFFLLCLQIDYDTQIRLHSKYKDMNEVLLDVMSSFAENALDHTLLLVKNHPLNIGVYNHRANTRKAAASYGITDRVAYIEFGDLTALLRAARGVIVVNSTVGPSALFQGCPVIALGKAFYDMDGLTHQGGLHTFWTRPEQPNPDLVHAFQRVLATTVCINGCYFTPRGRRSILPKAANTILNADHEALLEPGPGKQGMARGGN